MSINYFTTITSTEKIKKITKSNDSILIESFDLIIDNLHQNHIFESNYLNEEVLFITNLNFDKKNLSFKKLSTDLYKMYETKNKILIVYYNQNKNTNIIETAKIFVPFKLIFDKIGNRKQIITLYLNETYDSIINIYKVDFLNPDEIESITQTEHTKYIFEK